jgi:YidC/Oxa1 family membrane protein insertase
MKFRDPEIQDEIEDIRWTATSQNEGDQNSIVFSYTTSTGIDISKKLTFYPDSYFVDVDISFQNQSSEDVRLGGYDLRWGAGLAKDRMLRNMDVAGEGPVALVRTEKGLRTIKHWHRTGFACFGGKYVRVPEFNGPISWVAFTSKYFAAALIPGPEPWWSDTGKGEKRYAIATEAEDTVLPPSLSAQEVWTEWGNHSTIALVWPEFPVASEETVLHTYRVYVGPKKWDILRSVQGRDGATEKLGLGRLIDLGRFGILGKGALWLLKVFYRVIPNYGVGIIFLSILIKILYFPLMNKSFKSMRKMQELQPKLTALREKHRDDPQRMQKETMKMYKQHGASPWGGCLPMLFQLPVLFALFGTLRGAVELRGAVFISGWINDLALPDTVAAIGSIPIRILPLLMTGTMLLQQFIFGSGGGGGAGQSNKMMAFMPVIFLFFFYSVPSGLVLYWTCNSLLAMGHQYLIRRQDDTIIEDEEDKSGKGKNRNKDKNKIQKTRSKRIS